jgi:hypothetical protein
MKQALEIDDLHELAELLTAAEAADYLRISVLVALSGSRRAILTGSCRRMFMQRR